MHPHEFKKFAARLDESSIELAADVADLQRQVDAFKAVVKPSPLPRGYVQSLVSQIGSFVNPVRPQSLSYRPNSYYVQYAWVSAIWVRRAHYCIFNGVSDVYATLLVIFQAGKYLLSVARDSVGESGQHPGARHSSQERDKSNRGGRIRHEEVQRIDTENVSIR